MHAPPVGLHRLEGLISYCLDLSKQMLEKNGDFYPFGAVIDSSGKTLPVTIEVEIPARKANEVFQLLREGMHDQYRKGEIVAGALVAETTIPAELRPSHPEGIRIAVESSTIARVIFQPYKASHRSASPSHTGPSVEYGELLGLDVRPSIFAD